LSFFDFTVNFLPLALDLDDFPVADVAQDLDLALDYLLVLLSELRSDVGLDFLDDIMLPSLLLDLLLLDVLFQLLFGLRLGHRRLYDLHFHRLLSSNCLKSLRSFLLSGQFGLFRGNLLFVYEFEHVSLLLSDDALLEGL
jgi:hypothetical protein